MNSCSLLLENDSMLDVDEFALETCVELICAEEPGNFFYEISLLLCSDQAMRRYHFKYRGSDSITDVLSFITYESPPEQENGDKATRVCDIIIDINQIDRQKGNQSFDEELRDVFIHGLLHLMGYDHIKPEDRIIMHDKEQYYRQKVEDTLASG